ncbi:N-acyl-D-amino-acid deacylase family protein [Woeseia oceani]|uniref:N-acyl-D-amino-acid deacylase family protein n=1 Tax=Woeseia oceani TaxID=1548547 RepID=UPI0009F4546B|nr:amidohydrolase family protein [Woeseia oceani]
MFAKQCLTGWVRHWASLILCTVLAPGSAFAQSPGFDLIIANGRILDGTGNVDFPSDIGIRGDQIVRIGDLSGASAKRVIDAEGLYVAPGFIDLHSHADSGLISDEIEGRRAHNLVSQGLTTVVGAADGRNRLWPLTAEFAAYERLGIAMNMVPMVGHSTIRLQVMGDDYEREATEREVAAMKALLRDGMDAGAWGLGAGLEYRPARFSSEQEVLELASVLPRYDGFYIAHQRSEPTMPMWQLPSIVDGWPIDGLQALEETINIARETGVRVVASHVKARGRASWGRSSHDIALADAARDEGLAVYFDQYAYETNGGGPQVMVPLWAFAPPGFDRTGGNDDPRLRRSGVLDQHRPNLRSNLADPATRKLIERDIEWIVNHQGGPDRHIIVDHPDRALLGKTLLEAADAREESYVDTILNFALSGYEDVPGGFWMRGHSMHEMDVHNYMRQEYTATSSDAGIIDVAGLEGRPGTHPRMYGAFVRKIAHYAKDRKVISLPFAIRSSTGLPAQIIGLRDRGYLREGYKADIVVFDYDRIRDRATVMERDLYAEGIEYVLVNGTAVLDTGKLTGALPGVIVKRTGDSVR